jgi:hypothetical protein
MKNIHVDSQACVLWDDYTREDFIHLFFGCDFSQQFWWKLNLEWDTGLEIMDMLTEGKMR